MSSVLFACLTAIFVVLLLAMLSTIRLVLPHQRLILYRKGELVGERGPGIYPLIPILERGVVVDLRETTRTPGAQTCILQDLSLAAFHISYTYRITDPIRKVSQVVDLEGSLDQVIIDALRARVGPWTYGDARVNAGRLAAELRPLVSETAARWGVEITRFSVQLASTTPPIQPSKRRARRL